MPVHHVMMKPFDLFLVDCPSPSPAVAKDLCYAQMNDLKKRYFGCLFRGVALDRLEMIARNHIDVEPTDAVIFADHLDKALEYGHWPKLVLALRLKSLKRSFKVVPATASHSDLEMIRRDYPAVVRLDDGSLWCSRLREGDNRFASGYEKAY